MDLRQLTIFLAAVETGSFAAAGKKLDLSQSAVSLQIKSLEAELGVYLFDRSTRPPTPSARGMVLADEGQRILDLLEHAKRTVSDPLVRGKLTVGAVPSSLSSFLPASIATLRRQHPHLRLDLRSGGSAELAAQLTKGQLDLVVCTKPAALHPGWRWHPIASEPCAVIAPMHASGKTDAEILTSNPFIWFNRKSWAGRGIEQELGRRKINVSANMEIDTLEAIASLVGAGLGVSIIPMCLGARPLSGRLRSIPFGEPVFRREIGTLTPAQTVVSPQLTAFLDALNAKR